MMWFGRMSFCSWGCFFFFKQKTAYEMRISDWSSDVCSSDLEVAALNSKVALLTQSVQALRQEEYDLNREQQKRESLRAKEAQFATLDLFLEKKITHLVYAGEGAVQYKHFEKDIKEDDERHYSELRQIALFGDTKGNFDWREWRSGVWGKSVTGRVGLGGGRRVK